MFTDVGPYLLTLIAVLAVAYGIGLMVSKALLRHVQLYPFQAFFFHLFLGVVVCIIGFAIVKSGFRTVNVILLPLMGLLYYESKRIAPKALLPERKASTWLPPAVVGIAALLIFGLKVSLVYQGGAFPFVVGNGADYAQHALISEALAAIGVENKFAPESLLHEDFRSIVPYHYFDLWFNALVSTVSGLNHYLVLELVTYPLFLILGTAGFLALWETQAKPTLLAFIIALVFIGFGGLHFKLYNNIAYISKANYRMVHFGETLLDMPKLLYYLPFVFSFAILLVKRYYLPAFLVLAALSMAYFSAIILFALPTAFILVNLVKPVWIERREALRLAAYLVLPLVLWAIFFKLFGQSLEGTRDEFSLKLFDAASLRTRINIFGLSSIQAAVMYLPIIMGLGLMAYGAGKKVFWNKQVLLIAGLAALTFVVGLGAWVLAFENIDGMQLMGNNMPLVNALLLALFVWMWRGVGQLQSKVAFYGGVLMIVLLTFTTDVAVAQHYPKQKKFMADTYSTEFLMGIANEYKGEKNLVGVFLKGDAEYHHPEYWPAHRISQAFRLIDPLVLMPQYSSTVHFSVFDMPISTEAPHKAREENSFKGQLFNIFVESQKKNGNFKDIAQSQVDFIRQYDIKYLLITPSAHRPDWIEGMKRSEITDSKSGISFITLKP